MLHSSLSESARVILSGIICKSALSLRSCSSTLFLNFFHILCDRVFKLQKCPLTTVLRWPCMAITTRYLCSTAVNRAINCPHLTFKHLALCCPASKLDWCENSVILNSDLLMGTMPKKTCQLQQACGWKSIGQRNSLRL